MMRDINLLPEELVQFQKKRKKIILIILCFSGFILLLSMIYLSFQYIDYRLDRKINSVTAQVTGYDDIREFILDIEYQEEKIETRKQIIEQIESMSIDHSELIQQLYHAIPDEVILNEISLSEGEFTISGMSTNEDKIASFMHNLSKISCLDNIILVEVNYREANRPNFILKCQCLNEGV